MPPITDSEPFDHYSALTAYLVANGWVNEANKRDIETALAAFENTQRRRGSEAARVAMDKAARKAW